MTRRNLEHPESTLHRPRPRPTFPLRSLAALRLGPGRWNFHVCALQDSQRCEQLPYFNAERLSQALHCFDFNLCLISTFQLSVKLKRKAHGLRHLFLSEIGSKPEIAQILSKPKVWRHRASYQSAMPAFRVFPAAVRAAFRGTNCGQGRKPRKLFV